MCTSPRTKQTNAKLVNGYSHSPLSVTFPCGKCPECREARKLEYVVRSDAQVNDAEARGGYAYWDTFTYDEQNVPFFRKGFMTLNEMVKKSAHQYPYGFVGRGYDKTMDLQFNRSLKHYDEHHNLVVDENCLFLCFNPADYRNFFKKLRKQLERQDYVMYHEENDPLTGEIKKVSDLKYFWVCEYGGETHRPHYHCIFFVTCHKDGKVISPQEFEVEVRKAWTFGRIDEETPVLNKVIDGQGALNYVAKYVTKDADYVDTIEDYLLAINEEGNKSILKITQPFHRQSIGYGIGIITQHYHGDEMTLMNEEGEFRFTDKEGTRNVSLPSYIKRKLFYQQKRRADGTLYWVLNELGKDMKRAHLLKSIKARQDKYQAIYDAIPMYVGANETGAQYKDMIQNFFAWANCDLSDIALYDVLYRNRLNNTPSCPTIVDMIDDIADSEHPYDMYIESFLEQDENNYTDTLKDQLYKLWEQNADGTFTNCITKDVDYKHNKSKYGDAIVSRETFPIINQDTTFVDIAPFKGYDIIINEFNYLNWLNRIVKEDEYRRERLLKARMKALHKKYK